MFLKSALFDLLRLIFSDINDIKGLDHTVILSTPTPE